MEKANTFLSEDLLQCSICLDVFTAPVSVPCGHNFCKACIARHWKSKECCQCPLCNKKFSKEHDLCVNTVVRDIVEDFKKHQAAAANHPQMKPGEVPCDYCVDAKVKASKTCTVCLTSYCETHLEPHRRVATLKRHTLTAPVHNLEDKICRRHNRILELRGTTQVCALCSEDSAHDIDPSEEPQADSSAQVKKKDVDVFYFKRKRGKRGKKAKVAQTVKSDEMEHIYSLLQEDIGSTRGRVFYDVDISGQTGCIIGITRESNLQTKEISSNPRSGSWMLHLEDGNTGVALHNDPVNLVLTTKPKRVRVLVDHNKREVSFYDVDTMVTIYTFTNCRFKERVFLFYGRIEDSMWQKLRNLSVWLLWIFFHVLFSCVKHSAD